MRTISFSAWPSAALGFCCYFTLGIQIYANEAGLSAERNGGKTKGALDIVIYFGLLCDKRVGFKQVYNKTNND